ncbi:DUF5700 domain-containing putative Zn-dependent protease [Duganella qianjiadongensis]|uniref:DUF1570 domain-containing protein n=1 Tax=Duganella qianjiadongensis TaxID=2692176 RepID=A0ABW9VJE2_9BURK|nr:DUF5700 domain-containing putative Zn-dependent protease [Duganella qianjiadongensis]MYM39432.1 hypothetical protein [Duganella qianjiadongensis]
MFSFKSLVRVVLILLALCSSVFSIAADEQSATQLGIHFNFDFETARIVSKAVSTGDFDEAALNDFCTLPDAKAMIKKMRLNNCDALLLHLKGFRKSKKAIASAQLLTSELTRTDNGKYAPLAAEVLRQIKDYVPPEFSAHINVHFIFGSNSDGFTFDDVPDDVYVNLATFSEASVQELGETVAHELFHAVQAHIMRPESLPTAQGPASKTGPIWMNHLLVNLVQEGTAELFTHPVAERPPTPYSAQRKIGIERNAIRIHSLVTMFETLGWRLLFAPPNDEQAYDRIYGLMFYKNFDETAYDLGWLMASTIVKKDGKMAIFNLLKEEPKQFFLHYQTIALEDGNLPIFSDEFIEKIKNI